MDLNCKKSRHNLLDIGGHISHLKVTAERVATCVLLCFMIFGFASTAIAAPSLQWNTDRMYYDSQGNIIIEGYFVNNGTQSITWVNWHNVKVYFWQPNRGWWLQAETTYKNLNIHLNPNESIRWTFRITDVGYSHYDYYDVKWNVNYQYE